MTRAAEIRTQVLAYADQGLLEDEIAQAVGIPTTRVLRLLDTVEAAPVRQNEEWTPTKPRRRNSPATGTALALAPVKPRKRQPYQRRPDARPYGQTQHGTEAGYKTLHQRNGETPCAACTQAMRDAVNARRERPGGLKDRRRQVATAKRYHQWVTESFARDAERRSLNQAIRQTLMTPYTSNR